MATQIRLAAPDAHPGSFRLLSTDVTDIALAGDIFQANLILAVSVPMIGLAIGPASMFDRIFVYPTGSRSIEAGNGAMLNPPTAKNATIALGALVPVSNLNLARNVCSVGAPLFFPEASPVYIQLPFDIFASIYDPMPAAWPTISNFPKMFIGGSPTPPPSLLLDLMCYTSPPQGPTPVIRAPIEWHLTAGPTGVAFDAMGVFGAWGRRSGGLTFRNDGPIGVVDWEVRGHRVGASPGPVRSALNGAGDVAFTLASGSIAVGAVAYVPLSNLHFDNIELRAKSAAPCTLDVYAQLED